MHHAVDRATAPEESPSVRTERIRRAAMQRARTLVRAGEAWHAGPRVEHVSALGADVAARDAIALALDTVARALEPLAVTFFRVGSDGRIASSVVHASHLPPSQVVRQVRTWKATLRTCDPLAPSRLPAPPQRIATLRSDGTADTPPPLHPRVRDVYRHLGVANDARLLVRHANRTVAGLTLWRSWSARPWTSAQLRLLRSLQPLVEMAYLSELAADVAVDAMQATPALTRRERQVARVLARGATNAEIAQALHVSPNTAKTHTRTVLSKLGVTARRELVARAAHARGSADDLLLPARREPGDPALWIEAATPRQQLLLAPILGWAAERLDAGVGGFATVSARGSLAAEACGTARPSAHRLDRRVVRELRDALLSREVLARLAAHPAPPSATPFAALLSPAEQERVAGLVARLGLAMPLASVLRPFGRIAAVAWIAPDARTALDPREAARQLQALHPLLERAYAPQVEGAAERPAVAADLTALPLTARQRQIARFALDGAGNEEIAELLGIAQSTVKNHMTCVLEVCGVRSRVELIATFGGADRR